MSENSNEIYSEELAALHWGAGKFFIMSTEFDKNISDWGHDCTDHENGIGFFMAKNSRQKKPKLSKF